MLTGKGWVVLCAQTEKRIGKHIPECFTWIDLGMGCSWVSLASNCIKRISIFEWIHNKLWVNGSDCHTEIWDFLLETNWGYMVLSWDHLFECLWLSGYENPGWSGGDPVLWDASLQFSALCQRWHWCLSFTSYLCILGGNQEKTVYIHKFSAAHQSN